MAGTGLAGTCRRGVLKSVLGLAAMSGTGAVKALAQGAGAQARAPEVTSFADDERFWTDIAAEYDVTDDVLQVENGNWGMMPRRVFEAYRDHLARVNRDTSFYSRRGFGRDAAAVRERMAGALGVNTDEIVFTRNATEALKALILQYNRLTPGDAVLYCDLDYDSMQASMDSLAARHGASVVRIAMPEPASHGAIVEAYEQALVENPAIRLILLTRISHRTGLAIPVREIAAMARERGVDAIVDAAHSWYQIDDDIAALDCDFVGINGHKWLGAPLGIGVMYIRRERMGSIDPDPAVSGSDRIADRIHTGTVDIAAVLSAPAALDFHAMIGATRRTARLRALRDRWVSQVRALPGIEILTPDDPSLYASITSFRLAGRIGPEENIALSQSLLRDHGIFTVHRTGLASGACVRITPALFNTMSQMDRVAAALAALQADV